MTQPCKTIAVSVNNIVLQVRAIQCTNTNIYQDGVLKYKPECGTTYIMHQ